MEVCPYCLGILVVLIFLSLIQLNKLFKKKTQTGTDTSCAVKTPKTQAPSSSSKSGWDHEVFLNFRGTDTRTNFTDHLYHNLKDAGIRTFIDSDGLHYGESIGPELLAAIEQAKISIPIFSNDYASSKWCLRELAAMVKCMKNKGQLILPIFYDVDPSAVRHQKGSYNKAFREHAKGFDVEGWKKALEEVVDLKGYEVKKICDGREGQIIKMVVTKVLVELKKKYLVVTDSLVGIDDHVKELMRLLSVGFEGVRVIGISGMAGIGKTTTAKVIYNELLTGFECCSFLADVRETSQQHKGIVSLQNQLLSDILKGKSFDVTTVDEGINMIENRFRSKKVLIVLDDVSDRSHLKELGVKHEWFGSGSRIIVTTRDKDVINFPEVDSTYEITGLDSSQSLQLFSKHAFRREHPLEEYDSLSRDVVITTSGLPLALESIGSFLSGKNRRIWEETIKQLKEIPNDQVEKKLRISYEALNDKQKQIFLDIACLLNGVDKKIASYMWDACGFYPETGIEVLVLRCLVKYGDNHELRMHDQFRALGRQIVFQESSNDLTKRSRLWHYQDVLDVLRSPLGYAEAQALRIDFNHKQRGYSLKNEELAKLFNLRFLEIHNADVTGDFKNLFVKLRWLQWKGCPENFKPTNFHPENLVILDLTRSMVTENWEGWSQIEVAKNLNVLNLTGCIYLTRTPDFSYYANLERLILEGCTSLVQIDSSIGHLKRLVFLNMRRCANIKELPTEFSSLEALEELFIDGTSLQEFPICGGCMKKLEALSATGCHKLTRVSSSIRGLQSLLDVTLQTTGITLLPFSIGSLLKLRHLSLYCDELKILPDSIGKLESLTELHIVGGKFTEVPDSIGDLTNLIVLKIRACRQMNKLPDSIGNLKNLRVLNISRTGVRELPNGIGMLEKLEEIDASSSYLEGEIPLSFGGLNSLRILLLSATQICSIRNIYGLPNLHNLHLFRCEKLQFLPELPSSLKSLIVSSGLIKTLPNFAGLINLETLEISQCSKLLEIPRDICELSGLRKLAIYYCSQLEWLPALPSSLFKLSITDCPSMKRVGDGSDLKNLSELRELVIHSCSQLEWLPELPSGLFNLSIIDCPSMKGLGDLSNLKKLSELKVNICLELTEIQGLGKLELLRILDVHNCKRLATLDGLQQLVFLRELNTTLCDSLETLPNLSKLKLLRIWIGFYCDKLREIEGVEALESLEKLDLSGCKSLERLTTSSNLKISDQSCKVLEIEDLSNLKNLKELYLTNCRKLTGIQGIEKLKSLYYLNIWGCKALETLPDLSHIREVRR